MISASDYNRYEKRKEAKKVAQIWKSYATFEFQSSHQLSAPASPPTLNPPCLDGGLIHLAPVVPAGVT